MRKHSMLLEGKAQWKPRASVRLRQGTWAPHQFKGHTIVSAHASASPSIRRVSSIYLRAVLLVPGNSKYGTVQNVLNYALQSTCFKN